MNLKQKLFGLTAVLALGLSAGTASAVVLTADVAGTPSCDLEGASCNFVTTIDLGALLGTPGGDIQLNALGWDLTIVTEGASWLDEAVISFADTSGVLFTLTPGVGDSFPGIGSYSSGGLVDLFAALGAYPVLAGGLLTVEFYESFDDVSGVPDAFYVDPSTISLDFECVANCATPASEPGILLLFGLGLIGVVAARRRKA